MIDENHPELIREAEMRRKAQSLIPQCRECGMWPILKYEPGILSAECDCRSWESHEEDRIAMAREIRRELERELNE